MAAQSHANSYSRLRGDAAKTSDSNFQHWRHQAGRRGVALLQTEFDLPTAARIRSECVHSRPHGGGRGRGERAGETLSPEPLQIFKFSSYFICLSIFSKTTFTTMITATIAVQCTINQPYKSRIIIG